MSFLYYYWTGMQQVSGPDDDNSLCNLVGGLTPPEQWLKLFPTQKYIGQFDDYFTAAEACVSLGLTTDRVVQMVETNTANAAKGLIPAYGSNGNVTGWVPSPLRGLIHKGHRGDDSP